MSVKQDYLNPFKETPVILRKLLLGTLTFILSFLDTNFGITYTTAKELKKITTLLSLVIIQAYYIKSLAPKASMNWTLECLFHFSCSQLNSCRLEFPATSFF